MALTPAPSGSSLPNPALSQRTFLRHPVGLYLLFMVEMWERFSYYGMRGLLVLYLSSVISVHQIPSGTYSNTVVLTQTESVVDQTAQGGKRDVKSESEVRCAVVVGDGQAPSLTPDARTLAVKVEKLAPPAGWKAGDTRRWETPAADQSATCVVRVKDGVVDGAETHFRVSNPSDRTFTLTAQVRREPNPHGPEIKTNTFFLINDSPSVVSFEVKPNAQRQPGDDPYELVIRANTKDGGRNWTDEEANGFYGWYVGIAYLLPILGGLIADKLIGTHRSMIVGSLLIAMGHITLGLSGLGTLAHDAMGMTIFVFGCALITVGTGHFKPSVSVMVGDLYAPGDPRRESAFSIFYMGINLGAFLCNFVCGWLAAAYGWHYGFAAAAVGMLLGLGFYLYGKHKYLPGIGMPRGDGGRHAWIFLPIGIVFSALVAFAFSNGSLAAIDDLISLTWMKWLMGVASVLGIVYFVSRQQPGDRGPVATIFIYMLFNAVFWLSFEQAGSSLTLFTDRYTNRDMSWLGKLGDWIGNPFPTPYFQSVNPFLIIVLAPIFGVIWSALLRRKRSVPQPVKIGLGLILVGLGYVVMVFGAMRLNAGLPKVGMVFICSTYFLHTVGEIILSPTGLSYVAKTAPKQHLSSLMGIWFISSFIAGKMSGTVAGWVAPIISGEMKMPWHLGGQADFFLLFVITSVAAGLVIIAASPLLVRLQRGRAD